MSITAFPVLGTHLCWDEPRTTFAENLNANTFLITSQSNTPHTARILTDLNLVDTEVGVLTIGSAAIDDAVAWCLLILVISILHSTSMVTALYVFLVVRAAAQQSPRTHDCRTSHPHILDPFMTLSLA